MTRWLAVALVGALSTSLSAQQVLTPPTTNYSFSWDAPTGPEPVTEYQWAILPGGTFAPVVPGTAKTVVLPALVNGSYTAQSRACNTAGCGLVTSLAFTVGTTAPAVPGGTTNLRLTLIPPTGNVASYRSHATTTYAARSTPTTAAKPTGTISGDTILLVYLDGRNPAPSTTITPPAGFILLPGFPSSVSAGGFQVDLRVYSKVAGGSEPASYAVAHTGAALSTQALAIAVSGGAGVPTVTIAKGTGLIGTATGLTTTVDHTLILYIEHNWDLYGGAPVPSGTTPAFTERSDLASSLLYLATGDRTPVGATGAPAHTNHNGTSYPWQTLLIAVAP